MTSTRPRQAAANFDATGCCIVGGSRSLGTRPPLGLTGSGYASHGEHNVNTSVTAKIVRCGAKP